MEKLYPSAKAELQQNSVSPFVISIPQSAISEMEKIVSCMFKWSRMKGDISEVSESFSMKKVPQNDCVLMAYDFHIDLEGRPHLIEINTNASGFLVMDLIYKTHGIKTSALEKLKDSFFEEWKLFSHSEQPPLHTCIMDENISHQKMKYEFFMYHDLMKKWGWSNEVIESSCLKVDDKGFLRTPDHTKIDFIYNRLTDFYFEKHFELKLAYENQKVCFSPHPQEYFRLADKNNIVLWSQILHSEGGLESSGFRPAAAFLNFLKKDSLDFQFLKKHIPKTFILNLDSKEQLWKQRKKLFFKPLTGYGGRGAYRGSSITKSKWDSFNTGLAQEYIPPLKWRDPESSVEWKTDIRAYVYKDQIQMIGGRAYQGQLTNFQTPRGGFCCVIS